jgi:predicted  nucleic acid-binding Zn-ribbon protein
LHAKSSQAQASLDQVKHQLMKIETERKESELQVAENQERIKKYSLQQFQTKKNEEYKALAQEIEHCKEEINKLEDQQLEFMEQAEAIQKKIAAHNESARETKQMAEGKITELNQRESVLKGELTHLSEKRVQLAGKVDETLRARYERLLKHKGEKVIVGVEHEACGGCHVILPRQIIIACQSNTEVITCPNCGRLLYYDISMDMTAERG